MSTRGWTVSQLNDFFGEWAMHNVTWDYVDPPPETTAGGNQGTLFRSNAGYGLITDNTSRSEHHLRSVRMEPLDAANRRYAVPALQAPQRWGYNLVRLYPDAGATSVTVTFRGVVQAAATPTGAGAWWRPTQSHPAPLQRHATGLRRRAQFCQRGRGRVAGGDGRSVQQHIYRTSSTRRSIVTRT